MRWAVAPVKEPFSWPNSSLSIRFSGIAAQLTAMKGRGGAVAVLADAPGHEFLAGAALAGDHHGDVAGGHLADGLEHLLHRRGTPDDALLVVLGVDGRLVVAGGAQVGVGLQGVLREGKHLLRIERLHDVVERAVLHRLDGRLGRAKRGHEDDQLPGIDRADVLQRLDPAHPAHADVQEDDVRRAGLHVGDRLLAARGGGDVVIARGQHPRERVTDLGVVVDDQDRGLGGRHRQKTEEQLRAAIID